MLYDEIEDPESTTPAELRAAYLSELAALIDELGAAEVAERSGAAREALDAVAAGEEPTVDLETVAAVLGVAEEHPPEDAILLEARDDLLMGMTTAVLDVDTIAAEMDGLDAKQIQQKIEGRAPMTLAEFARLKQFIASRNDR